MLRLGLTTEVEGLAMCHTLWFIHLPAQGSGKGDEHPPKLTFGYVTPLTYLHMCV